MTSKRPRQVLTRRQEVVRAASAARVHPEELDRAAILGQIAAFLTQHRHIGKKIAFKGGAVMRLMDGSPRFSGDLDGVIIAGKQINQKWIDEALWNNPDAAKTFLGKPRIVNNNNQGIVYPIIECRAIRSGKNPITVKLSISWAEPLVLDPVWRELDVHRAQTRVTLPTVDERERSAEKVRAFLDRGDVNDAYDLNQFYRKGYSESDWAEVRRIIPIKLGTSRIPGDADLRVLFDEQVTAVRKVWPGHLVVSGGPPTWAEVEPGILHFRAFLP